MSRMEQNRTDRFKTAILLTAVAGLTGGLAFYVAGERDFANLIWIAGVVPALAALVVEILRSIGRGARLRRDPGGGGRRGDVFWRYLPRGFCRGPRPARDA